MQATGVRCWIQVAARPNGYYYPLVRLSSHIPLAELRVVSHSCLLVGGWEGGKWQVCGVCSTLRLLPAHLAGGTFLANLLGREASTTGISPRIGPERFGRIRIKISTPPRALFPRKSWAKGKESTVNNARQQTPGPTAARFRTVLMRVFPSIR